MAKPAKIKKKQSDAEPEKKGPKKAAPKAAAKAKETKAKPEQPKGLKARAAKAQAAKAKPAKGAAREKRSPSRFLREVRLEMSKVTWPSREELIQSTIVVLVAVVIAGVYIFIFDAIFSRLITAVNSLFS